MKLHQVFAHMILNQCLELVRDEAERRSVCLVELEVDRLIGGKAA